MDEDENLLVTNNVVSHLIPSEDVFDDNSISSSLPNEIDLSELNGNEEIQISLENCSNSYFAGYLGYKCFNEYKCNYCKNKLLKNNDPCFNEQEFLIFYKSYESKNPEQNV